MGQIFFWYSEGVKIGFRVPLTCMVDKNLSFFALVRLPPDEPSHGIMLLEMLEVEDTRPTTFEGQMPTAAVCYLRVSGHLF